MKLRLDLTALVAKKGLLCGTNPEIYMIAMRLPAISSPFITCCDVAIATNLRLKKIYKQKLHYHFFHATYKLVFVSPQLYLLILLR